MQWQWRLAASLAALALAPWAATVLDNASAAARPEAQTLSPAELRDEARPRPVRGEARIGLARRVGGRVLAASDLAEPRSPRAVDVPAGTAALDARSRIVLKTMSRGSLDL